MSARLLYVNEHQELDYVPLSSAPTTLYGRKGHPLKLSVGERAPRAQCRIFQREGAWHIENRGDADQTLVNGEPVKLQVLQNWDEVHCGSLRARFEKVVTASGDQELLAKLNRALEGAQTAFTASELARKAAEAKHTEAQADAKRLDTECARLRKADTEQKAQLDGLRNRVELLQREQEQQRKGLDGQLQGLREELRRSQDENGALVRARDQVISQLQAAEARWKEGEATRKHLAQTFDQQKLRLETAERDLTATITTNRELSERNQRLVELTETTERDSRECRERLLATEKELRVLQVRSQQEQADLKVIESLQADAARARRELEDCRSQLRRQVGVVVNSR